MLTAILFGFGCASVGACFGLLALALCRAAGDSEDRVPTPAPSRD